jgi:hypothetical protein
MDASLCICLYLAPGRFATQLFKPHGIEEATELSRALPTLPPLRLLGVKSCLL